MSSSRTPDVIVVIGNTGSGKSSFINDATESGQMAVSHSFRSCTTEVAASREFTVDGHPVVLLDTPGFSNTQGITFSDIMIEIKDCLRRDFRQSTLKGIIFLHAINETRALNSTIRNIKQFRAICGNDVRYALIVVTTMWDTVDQPTGVSRERELMTDESFFKIFTDAKVMFKRHPYQNSPKGESARNIVRCLLLPRNKPLKKSWWRKLFSL
ncbi:hypothetical protein CPB86DRAFT_796456 [Serendipita vermifera]|nr:hypothetical protein CPB86DRAFT_796456 [Serendipita vermifera]